MSARLKSNPCITCTKPAPSAPSRFVHRFAAEISESAGGHACCVHGHEKGADAVGAVLDAPSASKDQNGIGLVGNADRGFLAVEHITGVDRPCRQGEIGGV
jgi:hypothetical protein